MLIGKYLEEVTVEFTGSHILLTIKDSHENANAFLHAGTTQELIDLLQIELNKMKIAKGAEG